MSHPNSRTNDDATTDDLPDYPDTSQQLPETPAEEAAEEALREAERAVAEHRATPDQQRRVEAMALVRTRADRRDVWQSFDRTLPGADERADRGPADGK